MTVTYFERMVIQMKKRAISVILALVMVVGLLPAMITSTMAAGNDNLGLGFLLRGYASLSGQQLLGTNLKRTIFKNDAYAALANYCYFDPLVKANGNITAKGNTVMDYAEEQGIELGVSAKGEIGIPKVFKIDLSQKISSSLRESLKESSDAMFYNSTSWRREAIYDINFGSIPQNVIQGQLNPQFLADITNPNVKPEKIFDTYGTHFLTEYTMGGWAEASIYSIDQSINQSFNSSSGVEGTITKMIESGASLNLGTSTYKSETKTYGGYGGVITAPDLPAAQTILNNWINSFNRTDYWNVCEILAMPGDGNNRIKFEGIWELLPDGNKDRYNELLTEYMRLSIEQDVAFYNSLVYKTGMPGNAVKVEAEDRIGYVSPDGIIPISTADQFLSIGSGSYSLTENYILMSDIDLTNKNTNTMREAMQNIPFTGSFDGNGKTITGFTSQKVFELRDRATEYAGLFPRIGKGGIVKNLRVVNAKIEYNHGDMVRIVQPFFRMGIIAGLNEGVIENCRVEQSKVDIYLENNGESGRSPTNLYVGGITGENRGTVEKSYFISDNTANSFIKTKLRTRGAGAEDYVAVGGIVGYSNGGRVSDCYSNTKIENHADKSSQSGMLFPFLTLTLFQRTGGIVGLNTNAASITRCFYSGNDIRATDSDYRERTVETGWLLGSLGTGTITDCFYMDKSPGWWAVGNNPNPAGVKSVNTFGNVEMVRIFRDKSEIWEFVDGSDSHPRLPALAPSGSGFIVDFKNDYRDEEGKPFFTVGSILPRDAMTVYFETLDKDITNEVEVRYAFAGIGMQTMLFIYKSGSTTTYYGGMTVNVGLQKVSATGIALNTNALAVKLGGGASLTATVLPDISATGQSVTWETSDDSIATVNEFGSVIGRKLGTAIITATSVDGGFTAKCVVTVTDAIIVPSDTDDKAEINLTTETIDLAGLIVEAYSVNGGVKWKKGALPEGAKFQKLLDKGMTLWVADKWNAKDIKDGKTVIDKKGIAKDATVIKFPKINPRPKANTEKLKPFYFSETWEPRKGGATETSTVYEWANTTDKKTPNGAWLSISAEGFPVLSGKAKTTYLFRTPATANGSTYTPSSKIFKLTPANFGKAPNYKVKTDTKTSKLTIKLKAGDWYQLGNVEPEKVAAAKELDVTGQTGTLTIWKGETGKKPRSEKQEITLG
jgi:uncharacterized protein YjdB